MESTFHSDLEGPYWIDALSIDHANTLELNYQVAQMGHIDSRARCVHIWLDSLSEGTSPSSLSRGRANDTSFAIWAGLVRQDMEVLERCIFKNDYWSRAWITQKIILARNVTVLLGKHTIKLQELIGRVQQSTLNQCGVDYKVRAEDLAYDILIKNSEDICVCSASIVPEALDLCAPHSFTPVHIPNTENPILAMEVKKFRTAMA